jgi:hypothetical protein
MSDFYRTTLVIWTKEDPANLTPEELVHNYISYRSSRKSDDPSNDPHCDFSEYFNDEK